VSGGRSPLSKRGRVGHRVIDIGRHCLGWDSRGGCEFSGRIENMLTINVERINEVVVLRCSGRIVHGQETGLLCSALRQESRNVVLDLTEVDAIDAAGVGALLSLQAAGVYLKLLNPSRQVREILKATRLNSTFEICESQSIAETKQSMQEVSDNQSERFAFASSPNA
jgi:anti-anti-sigma factor